MTERILSKLDLWTLARLVAGYTFKEDAFPFHLHPQAETLARQLNVINYKDRELVLSRNLTAKEAQAVRAYNFDQEQPPPPDSDRDWTIMPARELKNLPPLLWLVPGEIAERGVTVLYGESGAGKSFIGLDYALLLAQRLRVVYVPTEGEAGYRKRVAAWCEHHHKSEGDLWFMFGSVSLFENDVFAEMMTDWQKLKPALVVIDTLAMAMTGADENSSGHMGTVMKHCRKINRTLGAAVLLVHHTGKAGVTERGSGALRGNSDVMIKVSPSDDLVLVECTKTKDEAPFQSRYIYLRPIAESLVPVPGDKLVRSIDDALTPNQRKMLDALSLEVNRDGISMRDLADMVSLSIGTTQRTLSNLLQKEMIHKPHGSYAITGQGLKAIGKSESGESVKHKSESHSLADESGESGESHDSPLFANVIQGDSPDSRDSSLKPVIHSDSLRTPKRKNGKAAISHWKV